jgi:hypothetical protein
MAIAAARVRVGIWTDRSLAFISGRTSSSERTAEDFTPDS